MKILLLVFFITFNSSFAQNVTNEISCSFGFSPYYCFLSIDNPDGLEFERVEGEHLENKTDSDLIDVTAFYQNTKNIPAIICNQFYNLEELNFYSCNIEILTESSFASCHQLKFLYIPNSNIQVIPENVFINNQNLEFLSFYMNKISYIEDNAFNGTHIEILGLVGNELEGLNQRWMAPLRGSL
jgi:Leucine-rich repeat (LRR) protein